jgi:hypothetical protein
MRTLRLALAGMAVLGLLIGASGLALAQEAPGNDAVPPDVAPVMEWITGTANCGLAQAGPQTSGEDWSRNRDWSISCWIESSDPRLDRADMRVKHGQDCTGDGCLSWGTSTVLGKGWSGWMIETEGPDGKTVSLGVLIGSGDNEGYTAVMTGVGQHGEVVPVTGFIYEGDPPPVP